MTAYRDLAFVCISAALGSLASFVALRLISPNPRKSSINGKSLDKSPARCPFDPSKREEYLSWDDYFMAIAFLSAERSKDPNRQVGACLVSEKGIILGIGYNGFPRGCSDEKLPWAKKSVDGNPLKTKYPYVVHAEVNAILNTNHASADGQALAMELPACSGQWDCTQASGHVQECRKRTCVQAQGMRAWLIQRLYVTMFPCNECAKIIIQSGVSEVIYFVDKLQGSSDPMYLASHKLLSMAGVKIRRHLPRMMQISVRFEEP